MTTTVIIHDDQDNQYDNDNWQRVDQGLSDKKICSIPEKWAMFLLDYSHSFIVLNLTLMMIIYHSDNNFIAQ
ncbi:hypothetical protein CWT02_1614 [Salmonella enterica subsp. enterica serovar Cubana]|nr:hypothetical protein DQ02_23900 [Citrobacter amalonaticus]PQB21721.1 hypothetical protein CWT02_1614 [Salmonella enterica subsp. enterica serovar Cubana]